MLNHLNDVRIFYPVLYNNPKGKCGRNIIKASALNSITPYVPGLEPFLHQFKNGSDHQRDISLKKFFRAVLEKGPLPSPRLWLLHQTG